MTPTALAIVAFLVARDVQAQGLHGDREAAAMARTMIERMGGSAVWSGVSSMHVVEEVHRPTSKLPYPSESWRGLRRPEIWFRGATAIDGRSENVVERSFFWTASTGWNVLAGVARPATQEELTRWSRYWPRNVYVMYARLARDDATLSVTLLSRRRFSVNERATGQRLGEFEVGEDGAIVRWSTSGGGESEEWIYGPLRDFGPVRMPDWGTRVSDGYRFYYRSITLRSDDAPLNFRTSNAPPLVLAGATLIDGTGNLPRPERTILVHDGRIVGVGDSTIAAPVRRGATILDLRGKFVIPGLCDAHAHFRYGDASLNRFLANGVTCLREMWGDIRTVASWRARIDAGTLFGPRILDVSAGLPNGTAPEVAVDSAARLGATFVKLGDALPRETYDHLMVVARARRLGVAGHLPWVISAIDAANMGQRSVEHADRLLFDAAAGADTLRTAMGQAATRTARFALLAAALAQFDSARADRLGRALAATQVVLTPTLLSARRLAMRNDSTFDADPRLRYASDSMRAVWRLFISTNQLDSTQRASAQAAYDRQMQLVRILYGRGVPILAGSDAGDMYVYDGSSLHDEMLELSRAGLPPMAVLQAATRNVVRVAGALDSLGTVSVGKLADLVILDADPLADITNVQRIRAVMRGGRLLERRELDAMLR